MRPAHFELAGPSRFRKEGSFSGGLGYERSWPDWATDRYRTRESASVFRVRRANAFAKRMRQRISA
jgi:hypothetical protein